MTEERMIRITKKGLNFINNLIESNQCSVGQELFSPEGFVWIYVFDKLEPAPPKDWKPYCYNPKEIGKCSGMCHPIADDEMADCCLECPFRIEALK